MDKNYLFYAVIFILLLVACNREQTPEQTQPELAASTEPVELNAPYLNPELPVSERVEDLLARMTLAEKIGQMTLVEKNSINEEDITSLAIGALLSGGGGTPAENTPEGWVEMVDGFQNKALETRLGIPLLYGVDSVHGHGNLRGAVLFPHNIGLGATRDAELVTQIGQATALETAATGIYWNYAPVLAVPQDIRWGRTYEGYSENTELVTALGEAYLRGLQGEGLAGRATILATPKHFVGDGGTSWGSSTTENYMIDQGVTGVNEETLRAVHLPPYVEAVAAGARSIMVSFSSWGDTKMHAQKYLISDVLKDELAFEGFVVSDWQGINQISGDYYEAIVTAINAGIDMNMVPYDYGAFVETLTRAVENGDVSQERIDDAVRRILAVKFELGLFENPYAGPELLVSIGSEEHRQLARQAAGQSLVLLKNEDDILPIETEPMTIFVGGEAADDIGLQSGGWTIQWQGAAGDITEGTTLLEAIEATASDSSSVYYDRSGRLDGLKTESGEPVIPDICLAIAGERPYAEGLGDSADLSLPDIDLTMLENMSHDCQKLAVILISGRPVIITGLIDDWDAVVAAWLPGTEGQGVADVLFGDRPFSGKLPYTWPRSVDQLPFDFDELVAGENEALFPYGYGLE